VDQFSPATDQELARFVADNAFEPRRPLRVVGGRTARLYGYPAPDDALEISTRDLARVVDYPARDMTITVESGIRVNELQSVLAEQGQRLAVDIAEAHRATLGGAVATNTFGPGLYQHGTFRDHVIGVRAVDGHGRLFAAGGRVVKNVAGYDLCKLLVGSLGTLAIITQLTLRLRPVPESRHWVWCRLGSADDVEPALERLNASATRPLAIEVLNAKAAWQVQTHRTESLPCDGWVLGIAFEGSDAECHWQAAQVKEELASYSVLDVVDVRRDEAQELWTAFVEYQATSDDPLTFKATLPPSRVMQFAKEADARQIAVQAHAGSGIVVGHFPDAVGTVEEAAGALAPLRTIAEQHGGALVILSCDAGWKSALSVYGTPRAEVDLMRRIKRTLDPAGLLNPNHFGPAT